ncbi:MAG: hypothetical protein U5K79_00515 [Cyclobacteriaceae bacterium]|nr:hypothetical protein [Cyclobacteriaceae bacterium]
MKEKTKLTCILYIIGVVAMIIGALDPMEGSVIILGGNVLLVISLFMTDDCHKKHFLITLIMIAIGVFFLFYLSSLGGFGGTSELSWWWGITILPYPIAWIFAMIMLIFRVRQKQKANT